MAKRKPLHKSDPVGTLEDQLNQDFNAVINEIHSKLSTKKYSPVWTGFFASSWKVQTMAVAATEKAEDFQPWKSIKYERSLDFFARQKAGPPYSKQTPPANPQIKIRYPITKTFNIKRPVFIGNRAVYAAYALEGGKIQNFVQGQMRKIINDNMKEKKGKLFLASDRMGAQRDKQGNLLGISKFGQAEPSTRYTEVNLKKL